MNLKTGSTDTLKNRQDHRREFKGTVEVEETVEKTKRKNGVWRVQSSVFTHCQIKNKEK